MEASSAYSRTDVRRKDRAVADEAWIMAMLGRAPLGHLATADGQQPFLHANLFVFDPTRRAIYFHTGARGRTRANIESNPNVCFSVSEMGRLLPARTALEFSVEYASVIVFGHCQVVSDPSEARTALQLLLDKYFSPLQPGQDYAPIQPEEMARTSVFRIDVEEWSGKQKLVPPDFPGAFTFEERRPT